MQMTHTRLGQGWEIVSSNGTAGGMRISGSPEDSFLNPLGPHSWGDKEEDFGVTPNLGPPQADCTVTPWPCRGPLYAPRTTPAPPHTPACLKSRFAPKPFLCTLSVV